MCIDTSLGVKENESLDAFLTLKEDCWNGRKVETASLGTYCNAFQALAQSNLIAIRTIFLETMSSNPATRLPYSKEKLSRMLCMARAADRSDIIIEAGHDENRGTYIQGRLTWSWENKDTDSSSENDRTQPPAQPDPPDSRDRDTSGK